MPSTEAIRAGALQSILLGGQAVPLRVLHSKTAARLRVRVRRAGEVELVLPERRAHEEGVKFLVENQRWVLEQLSRARRRISVRLPVRLAHAQVWLGGELCSIEVMRVATWSAPNRVELQGHTIRITTGPKSRASPARSLENWLRKGFRERLAEHVQVARRELNCAPVKTYLMSQRSQWGSCSTRGNLSFNWRLAMAPEFVTRYVVAHEMAHLVVPDHSPRFWLTVQDLCHDSEKARGWLVANGQRLLVDLSEMLQTE